MPRINIGRDTGMRACLSAASAVSRAASALRSVDLAARRFHSKDTKETARAKIATTSSPDTHVFLPLRRHPAA
jgi:hypothetical protein